MLKDRKLLIEKDIAYYKHECGQLYLAMVVGTNDANTRGRYEAMRTNLATLMSDLAIIEHMIADGHE